MKIKIAAVRIAGLLTLGATAANAALDDATAQELMKKAGCAACHSVDKKGIGPAYMEIGQKRKGESDAIAALQKAVRGGSKGTYGSMPMPPTPSSKISDADLHELIQWVLTK